MKNKGHLHKVVLKQLRNRDINKKNKESFKTVLYKTLYLVGIIYGIIVLSFGLAAFIYYTINK
jgi:hypothetical protein